MDSHVNEIFVNVISNIIYGIISFFVAKWIDKKFSQNKDNIIHSVIYKVDVHHREEQREMSLGEQIHHRIASSNTVFIILTICLLFLVLCVPGMIHGIVNYFQSRFTIQPPPLIDSKLASRNLLIAAAIYPLCYAATQFCSNLIAIILEKMNYKVHVSSFLTIKKVVFILLLFPISILNTKFEFGITISHAAIFVAIFSLLAIMIPLSHEN